MSEVKFQPVIGLEIHSELKTNSKMFCSCPNEFKTKPNINICPVCLGHPGTLPVINKKAVKKVIKAGLALNCEIARISKFDRKNYIYPDLPKGYQISQYDMPLCGKGYLKINGKKIRIRRIHLEEDAGKLIHTNKDYSLVDFNRAGVPLMELVTEPDIRSAEEAVGFAKKLQLILRYLNISNADMEKGQMRVEVNISLSRGDKINLSNNRVEIKNLNSFKAVKGAIKYETKRQAEVIREGEVVQETRGWATASGIDLAIEKIKVSGSDVVVYPKKEWVKSSGGITISQRIKEDAHDYRYLPEPDLPPLTFTDREIKEIKKEIGELPEEKRERFKKELELKEENIDFFIQNLKIGRFFEKLIGLLKKKLSQKEFKENVQLAANYITSDLQGLLKQTKKKELLFSPENFYEFVILLKDNKISSRIAKKVLREMFETGKSPFSIIEKKGLSKIDSQEKINNVIEKVLSENKEAVSDFKSGKENALQFLIGQILKETKGRANIKKVKKLLKERLQN